MYKPAGNKVGPCSVQECSNVHPLSRKMCHKHYTQWYRSTYGNKKERVYQSKPETRFSLLKRTGLKKGVEVSLTYEEFLVIHKSPCIYCSGVFDQTYSGYHLDRVDNNKGYTKDNVVSCCSFCNSIKQELLTKDETLAVINLLKSMRKKV